MSSAEKPSKGNLVPKTASGITTNNKRKGEALEKKIREIKTRRSIANSSVKSEKNVDIQKLNTEEGTDVAKTETIQEELDSKPNTAEKMCRNVEDEERTIKSEISKGADRTILPEKSRETTKNDEPIGKDGERVTKSEIVDDEKKTNLPKKCRTMTKNKESSKGIEERISKSGIVESDEHVKSPAKRRAVTNNEESSIPRQNRQSIRKSEVSDKKSDFEEIPLKKRKNLQASNNITSISDVAATKTGKDSSHNTPQINDEKSITNATKSEIKKKMEDDPGSRTNSQKTNEIGTPSLLAVMRSFGKSESQIDSNLPKESPKRSRRKTSPREAELEEEERLKAIYSHVLYTDSSNLSEDSRTTTEIEGLSSQSKLAGEVNSELNNIDYEEMQQSSAGSCFQSRLAECEVKLKTIENDFKSQLSTKSQPTASQPTAKIEQPASQSKIADSRTTPLIVESPFDYVAWLEKMNSISK